MAFLVGILYDLLLQEFKGFAITVIKLNPVRDYVVYGTSHGYIRVERVSKIMVN